jgi:hypothetical protein
MPDLRSSIHSLAQSFAAQVLEAIRSSSLEEILGESSGAKRGPERPPGRRGPGRPQGVNRVGIILLDELHSLTCVLAELAGKRPSGSGVISLCVRAGLTGASCTGRFP